MVPLLVAALGWVLYSPYTRGNAGVAYSDINSANANNAARDWSPSTTLGNFSLHEIVLVWGATPNEVQAPPYSGSGLSKGIAYTLHPRFCEELLPKFPEDGKIDGHIDGFVSFLTCDDLRAALVKGFSTWAANSKHISFHDVTESCWMTNPTVDPVTGGYFCAAAEVTIMPSDMTGAGEPKDAVGLFVPDFNNLDTTPSLTSGSVPPRGLELRAAPRFASPRSKQCCGTSTPPSAARFTA